MRTPRPGVGETSILPSLKMEESLVPFQLEGVEETGEELGRGSYAKVVAVQYKGLRCAAKKVYEVLRYQGGNLLERFAGECSLLSGLRHPHIVQFLGVYFEHGLDVPVLVMEYLPATLAGFLDNYGVFPDEIGYSVLRDVALGVTYLHGLSPPIVHGDLTANNVLLSWDLTAKIADVGVARMLNLPQGQASKSAKVYLPPEALTPKPQHSRKVDCFSFGILMIHTLSARFPTHMVGKSVSSEANGVGEYIEGISFNHPLSTLILQCINKLPQLRPEIVQILATLSEMMLQFPQPSFERRIEILHRLKIAQTNWKQKVPIIRKDSIATLSNSIEIEHLKLQIEELQVENKGLLSSLRKQQNLVSARDHEMAAKLMAKDQEILAKHQELCASEAAVEACQATITAKEATVQGLTKQLRHLQDYIATKHQVSMWSFHPQSCLKS